MRDDLQVRLETGAEAFDTLESAWDRLVSKSGLNSVFATHAWLTACLEVFSRGKRILVPTVWSGDRLVGAAAFQETNGVIEFVGHERSDYLGLIVSKELDDISAALAVDSVLQAVIGSAVRIRRIDMRKVPVDSRIPELVEANRRFHCFRAGEMPAPSMGMEQAEAALKKKSLVRHENKLQRLGELSSETFVRAQDIQPRLEEFFEQHIRRWDNTPYPSLFLEPINRDFYREVVRRLDVTAYLRFTEIRLDGRLIASHFGFSKSGTFTWYKPTFEPELAKLSPGEVLIKKLIQAARDEGCSEFDFTIGGEAFKRRFATKTRTVIDLAVTDSRFEALRIQGYQRTRKMLSQVKKLFKKR